MVPYVLYGYVTYFERLRLRVSVKEVNVPVVCPAEDVVSVLAESDGEEAEAAILCGQGQRYVTILFPRHVHLMNWNKRIT